jgi:hypothetical protein
MLGSVMIKVRLAVLGPSAVINNRAQTTQLRYLPMAVLMGESELEVIA